MASTLCSILLHVCFSTKDREPTIPAERADDVYGYIGGVCRANASVLLHAGGMPDHVHLLVSLGKTIALADLMMVMKRDTSKWIKAHGGPRTFHWQDGYFAFSIGESGVPALRRYIATQAEHHRTRDFKEEMRAFMRRYRIEWDERYVWA